MTRDEVLDQLVTIWDSCAVIGDDQSTFIYKLVNREVEDLRIVDSRIHFTLERHGALVRGSTFADLHHWVVDPKTMTKWIEGNSRRRLGPPSAKIDIAELVSRISIAIEQRDPDVVVELSDGALQVKIARLIPDSGPRQTVTNRRKRVRNTLAVELAKRGLQVSPKWIVRKNF
jgi:hypothetical protein